MENRHKKHKKIQRRIASVLRQTGLFLSEQAGKLKKTMQRIGPYKCLFAGLVLVLLIVLIIVICTLPARQKENEALHTEEPAAETVSGMTHADAPEQQLIAVQEKDTSVVSTPEPAATPEIRFERGSEGDDVLEIQQKLMELGFLAIDEPTSYFGSATKEAVKLFQRQNGLETDGIIGNETYSILMSGNAVKYVMMEGFEGSDISDFQDKLVELGYLYESQVTGYYGTDTVSAVKKFQKRNKLKQDGKAGEKTIETVNSADARVSYTKEQEIAEEKAAAEKEASKKSATGRISTMISAAKSQLGKPYILGAKGPDSFDCSGLVYYCLKKADVYCRRLDASGYARNDSWKKITNLENVKKGDLLFFRSETSNSVGHVGIYIGSGEMIDASSGNGSVVRRSCKTAYWKRYFVCARRPIE